MSRELESERRVREWAPSWTDASLAAMSFHLKSEKNLALLQILIESVNPSIIKVMLNQANHLSGNLSKITNEETINNTTQRLGFLACSNYLWPITFNYPGILWNIYNTHVCLYNRLWRTILMRMMWPVIEKFSTYFNMYIQSHPVIGN